MAKGRARGTGSIYQPNDPQRPGRKLQTWWICYWVNGTRYRESSKSRNRSDAVKLLKQRLGEHAVGRFVGAEAGRVVLDDLREILLTSYRLAGRRSAGRVSIAFGNLAERFGGMRAIDIKPRLLGIYAVERRKDAKPADRSVRACCPPEGLQPRRKARASSLLSQLPTHPGAERPDRVVHIRGAADLCGGNRSSAQESCSRCLLHGVA